MTTAYVERARKGTIEMTAVDYVYGVADTMMAALKTWVEVTKDELPNQTALLIRGDQILHQSMNWNNPREKERLIKGLHRRIKEEGWEAIVYLLDTRMTLDLSGRFTTAEAMLTARDRGEIKSTDCLVVVAAGKDIPLRVTYQPYAINGREVKWLELPDKLKQGNSNGAPRYESWMIPTQWLEMQAKGQT